MMRYALFVLIAIAMSAHAAEDPVSELMSTPATQYELGVLRLEMIAMQLNQQYAGEEIGRSDFDLIDYFVLAGNDGVLFGRRVVGPARDVTMENCRRFTKGLADVRSPAELASAVWPNRSEVAYERLAGLIRFGTVMVAKENEGFTVKCTDGE